MIDINRFDNIIVISFKSISSGSKLDKNVTLHRLRPITEEASATELTSQVDTEWSKNQEFEQLFCNFIFIMISKIILNLK